jgi:hypothetical protein
MSGGWGGRLFGFLCSTGNEYTATEPNIRTYNGLKEVEKALNFRGKKTKLLNIGSELYKPKNETLDLCFTSPPYFDTEKYSTEKNQSYIKFPKYEQWTNGYLKETFKNCFSGLKPGGKMIINISNTPKLKTIEKDTIKISLNIGFKHRETYFLELSSIAGKGTKAEPIFIFTKPH